MAEHPTHQVDGGHDTPNLAQRARDAAANKKVDDLDLPTTTRRALTRLGCNTFLDVIEYDERGISSALQPSEAYRVLDLVDLYASNPAAFIRRIKSTRIRFASTSKSAGASACSATTGRQPTRPQQPRMHSLTCQVLPRNDLGRRLRSFESKATSALQLLEDHSQEALVMETFPLLGLDIEQAEQDIKSIISTYGCNQTSALDMLAQCAPSTLLVACSHLAQELYTGRSLWPELFDAIGLRSYTLQGNLKQLLLNEISSYGFPVYASEDESQYYLNTMLLHSGLSKSVWKPLWRDLLIRAAEEVGANGLVDGIVPNGEGLLFLSRDNGSRFKVDGARLQKMLQHVPVRMIGPVLEDAFSAAQQVIESAKKVTGGTTNGKTTMMLSGSSIPEAAVNALVEVLAANETTSTSESGRTSRGRGASVAYLPEPEVRLNLTGTDNPICLHWNDIRLPKELVGDRVDYYVNHALVGSAHVIDNVNSAMLRSAELHIAPSSYFDIELKLIKEAESPVPGGNAFTRNHEVAARSSSFRHTRPDVFEFLRGHDGIWRLRRRLTSLERRMRIAYLMAPGHSISPQGGMSLVERETIGNLALEVYDVDPGASADLLDERREKVSSWNESYIVEFEKPFKIGRNERGNDVFPYLAQDGCYNAALPTIVIKSMGTGVSTRDIDVSCVCDNHTIHIARSNPFVGEGCGTPSSVTLSLPNSSFPPFVTDGLLIARQTSTGKALLRYRFSVVPIRALGILSLEMMLGRIRATYRIKVTMPVDLTRNGTSIRTSERNVFDFSAPLSDTSVDLTIRRLARRTDASDSGADLMPDGPAQHVRLFLAAMDVRLGKTGEASEERPLDLADVVCGNRCDGYIEITYEKSRPHRGALALFGQIPLHYYADNHPAQFRLNLFNHADAFVPSSTPTKDERMCLQLTVSYGFDWRGDKCEQMASAITLINARKGFGLGSASLNVRDDNLLVKFDHPAGRELVYRLVSRGENDLLDEPETLGRLEHEITLPTRVHSLLKRGRHVWILLAAKRRLWGADFERAQRVDLSALYEQTSRNRSHG